MLARQLVSITLPVEMNIYKMKVNDYKDKKLGYHRLMDKRRFFKVLAGEVVAFFDELRGKPQFRLSELWELPDRELAQIMPKVLSDIEIIMTEEHVSAQRHGEDKTIVLFDCEPVNTFVFNRFNGLTTIGQIGTELATAMFWDKKQGFTYTRNLFLQLIRLGVCVPSNPIG